MDSTVLPFDANSGEKRNKAAFCAFWHGRLNSKRGEKNIKTSNISVRATMAVAARVASGRFHVCRRNKHKAKVLKTTMATTKCCCVPQRHAGIAGEVNYNIIRENYSPTRRYSGGYLTLKLRSLCSPSPHPYALFFFVVCSHWLTSIAWSSKSHITHTAYTFSSFWRCYCCC